VQSTSVDAATAHVVVDQRTNRACTFILRPRPSVTLTPVDTASQPRGAGRMHVGVSPLAHARQAHTQATSTVALHVRGLG
jgi:hypothetical protein